MTRRRTYRLFAGTPWGPFTIYTAAYGRGTHPWVVDVVALSVRQAYALAGRNIWATGARGVGIRGRRGPGGVRERAGYLGGAAA